MTLLETLTDAAAAVPDLEAIVEAAGDRTWSVAGRPFATLGADGEAAEFGLDPAVAAAAQRTPDVVASERGPGWVRFRPAVLDEHGRDRARAWFESASRRAARTTR